MIIATIDESPAIGGYKAQLEQALPFLIDITDKFEVTRQYFKETGQFQIQASLLYVQGDPFLQLKKKNEWQMKLIDFLLQFTYNTCYF